MSGDSRRRSLPTVGSEVGIRLRSALVLVVLAFASPQAAWAACDTIPGTINTFRGALGAADRPFAAPGTFVELRVRPEVCDAKSTGFTAKDPGDYAVTLVFEPPMGPRSVVVVAKSCGSLESARADCEDRPEVALARCIEVSDRPGETPGLAFVVRNGERRLAFRFPDTDAFVGAPDDDRTFTGPVTIAVRDLTVAQPGERIACELASATCTEATRLVACIDQLFELDGTCNTTTEDVEATFGHFTALPPPNNYQALCTTAGLCTGVDDEIHMTIDAAGNLLIPVDWRGVLGSQGGDAVPRLLRGSSAMRAFSALTEPIDVPGSEFLGSYTQEGRLLPPIFDPQSDPESTNELTLFGSVDAPYTILRVSRRSPVFRQCSNDADRPCIVDGDCPGGTCETATCIGTAQPCSDDVDCPGSECGPSLFDFGDVLAEATGPIVVPRDTLQGGVCEVNPSQTCTAPGECGGGACVEYRLQADIPVPLQGLRGTEEVFAFSVRESLAGTSLNDDGDETDFVLEIRDRKTGSTLPIGEGGAVGRAVVQLNVPPFQFPAVEASGELVAFLEPEAYEGDCATPTACDKNGDGDAFDTLLRIFRQTGSSASDVLGGQVVVADAEPVISQRSMAVSGDWVFFRRPEAANAERTIKVASVASDETQGDDRSYFGALSADGRYVAFYSHATTLEPDGNDGVFVRDLIAGTTELVSVDSDETPGTNVPSATVVYGDEFNGVTISPDGRYVAFYSGSTDLVAGDINGTADAFLRDRVAGTTEIISVAGGGSTGAGIHGSPSAAERSKGPALSPDASFVTFASNGSGLVPPGSPIGDFDVFVHERIAPNFVTEDVSVEPHASAGSTNSYKASISEDGRYVGFESLADGFFAPGSPGAGSPGARCFRTDRLTGQTATIETDPEVDELSSIFCVLSADGRSMLFAGQDGSIGYVPGDTNGLGDVFVRDLETGLTELISAAPDGGVGNGKSGLTQGQLALTRNGRFVAFTSRATDLVPGADGGIFVRDRLTGITELAAASAELTDGDATFSVDISDDGQTIVYDSRADVALGDLNGEGDVYVRSPDSSDVVADVTGDGLVDDVILAAIDTTDGTLVDLCPATQGATASGAVAFLRPEAAGPTPDLAGCPAAPLVDGNPDLNGDGDASDDVVHFWSEGSGVLNLGCAASAVALSATHLAAVTDAGVKARALGGPAASCADPSWMATGQQADEIATLGSVVAFITDEAEQGEDLNLDGDDDDRVLQLFEASTATLVPVRRAVEDFVLSDGIIAYRVDEASQGEGSLNGDGDASDDVLEAWDLVSPGCLSDVPPASCRFASGQAVTPCTLPSCDRRFPYRPAGGLVKFLTLESEQGGQDLNGDLDALDVVIQQFRAGAGTTRTIGTVRDEQGGAGGSLVDPLGGSSVSNEQSSDAPGGEVFVTNGRCTEVLDIECSTDVDCPTPARCADGVCSQEHGVCVTSADCPTGICEESTPVVATSADVDEDGIADAIDDCPLAANPLQEDTDGDEIGDACDLETCGNDTQELSESCDGTDDAACPGLCKTDCTCPCTNMLADPNASVKIVSRRDAGKLSAVLLLPISTYDEEGMTVLLEDGDGVIAQRTVGPPPSGKSGRKWQFKQRADGLNKIVLRKLPIGVRVSLKSRRWFTAAEADESAAATRLTIAINGTCFVRSATKKID